MKEFTVCTEKKYSVTIAKDLSCFDEKIKALLTGDKVAIIADETAFNLHSEKLLDTLKDKQVFIYKIKSGEESKNLTNYGKLLNNLAKDGFTRADSVITFGGGMVGDLGAFVASTYMRGIRLFAIPTTLLAMVDSSIGGKTSINISYGKNLCGTFYQPNGVYVNTAYLGTLPQEQIESGFGEILKYCFLSGGEDIDINFDIKNYSKLEDTIYRCLKIKAEIIAKDERECGDRKLLNFGHTVGHAIEKLSDFKIPHGICVAKGIAYAIRLSKSYYHLSNSQVELLFDRLKIFSDLECMYSAKGLAKVILSDKKVRENCIDFILIDNNLSLKITPIATTDLVEFLRQGEK